MDIDDTLGRLFFETSWEVLNSHAHIYIYIYKKPAISGTHSIFSRVLGGHSKKRFIWGDCTYGRHESLNNMLN